MVFTWFSWHGHGAHPETPGPRAPVVSAQRFPSQGHPAAPHAASAPEASPRCPAATYPTRVNPQGVLNNGGKPLILVNKKTLKIYINISVDQNLSGFSGTGAIPASGYRLSFNEPVE